MVKFIEDEDAFHQALKDAGDKLVVVDFTARWCGPCKLITPFFEEMATKHTDCVFLKVDVDDATEVAQMCNVHSMPTFQFYKNCIKVAEFSGANKEKLKEKVEQYK